MPQGQALEKSLAPRSEIRFFVVVWSLEFSEYLDLQSGTFTGSGAGLPTPAFFWIWSGTFSKSRYVDSQGFAFFVVCISLKVNPLLMQ